MTLDATLREARACRVCAPHLPHEPRPVLRAAPGARLLIVGQAPGRRVHESGIPWNDPSGDRLRAWLAMPREDFYDETRVAIVPMGLCYPGTVDGADLPPRRECAPLWQARVRAQLPGIGLTLLIGAYSQTFHLGARRRKDMTGTVRNFDDYLPDFLPLPHPSWRNSAWLRRNAWFEEDLLPALRARVRVLMEGSGGG
jgi:uracil-DNA glycosylase